MKLSTKSRYAVQALFDLAYHGESAAAELHSAQASEIAKRQGIPLRYLEQVFVDLRRGGLVESKRGPRGGYTLRRDPSQISLGDIVRATQGPIEDLFDPDERIPPGAPRSVTVDLWKDLGRHVREWFDGMTLLDLVRRAQRDGVARAGETPSMYFI